MWCFWSAKGGAGCTTVAVTMARALGKRSPTVLIDLAGDAAAVLGRPDPAVGLAQWMSAPAPPPDALSRIEVEVGDGLSLLSWGPELVDGEEPVEAAPSARHDERPAKTERFWPGDGAGEHDAAHDPLGGRSVTLSTVRAERPAWAEPSNLGDRSGILARLVDFEHRSVVVDIGLRSALGRRAGVAGDLLSLATRSTLVTRACSLSMRAAGRWPHPDDVVLVGREGRAIRAADVGAAVGAPVVATVRWDPAVARAVDSGFMAVRRPRSLRALDRLVSS